MAEASTAEWFPSEEWLAAYRTNLNESERYREESEGWGVDFEGDFVFEIRDLPLEVSTLGEFPDGLTEPLREDLQSLSDDRIERLIADAPPALRERIDGREGDDRERLLKALFATPIAEMPEVVWPDLREELPADLENLLGQLERYVADDTVRVHLDLVDGECRSAEVIEPDAEPDPGFALRGPYVEWKALVEGADVMDKVLGEALHLDGSVTTIIGYADAADEMGAVANRTASTPLFEGGT